MIPNYGATQNYAPKPVIRHYNDAPLDIEQGDLLSQIETDDASSRRGSEHIAPQISPNYNPIRDLRNAYRGSAGFLDAAKTKFRNLWQHSTNPFSASAATPLLPQYVETDTGSPSAAHHASPHEIFEDVNTRQAHDTTTKARIVASTGMLCGFYNLALINTAKPLMRAAHGMPSTTQESLISSASLAGAMVGQTLLGSLADKIGRKPASLLSAAITTVGALGSLFARPWNQNPASIYDVVTVARFLSGVGTGGDFPILASITAENTSAANSARDLIGNSIMAAGGSILTQIVYATLIPNTNDETAWRTAAGIAALLSLGMILSRQLLLPDNPTARLDTSANDDPEVPILDLEAPALDLPEAQPSNTVPNPINNTGEANHNQVTALWRPLLATAACWTLYDMVDFSLGMYSSDILGSPDNPQQGALMTMALNGASLLGALAATQLVDPKKLGRNNLQTLGFAGLAGCHLLLAASAGQLWQDSARSDGSRQVTTNSAFGRAAFFTLYGLQQLFDSVGPAIGVYLIPAEIFPSAVRSTCMGIAASTGKLGAVLGTAMMPFIRNAGSLSTVFLVTGMLSAIGALATRKGVPHYGPQTIAKLDNALATEGAPGVLRLLYPETSPNPVVQRAESEEIDV